MKEEPNEFYGFMFVAGIMIVIFGCFQIHTGLGIIASGAYLSFLAAIKI